MVWKGTTHTHTQCGVMKCHLVQLCLTYVMRTLTVIRHCIEVRCIAGKISPNRSARSFTIYVVHYGSSMNRYNLLDIQVTCGKSSNQYIRPGGLRGGSLKRWGPRAVCRALCLGDSKCRTEQMLRRPVL